MHVKPKCQSKRELNPLQGINKALLQPRKTMKSNYDHRIFNQKQEQIRENQLNSKFLVRKRRLESICRENKNIFVKINTQKSNYAREQMNKSYRSSSQISKRMSRLRAQSRESQQSRISRLSRDNSFTSKRKRDNSFTSKNRPMWKTPCRPVICETLDVNKLDDRRLLDMKTMFGDNLITTPAQTKIRTHSSNKQNTHFDKYKLPTLKDKPNILTQRNKFEIFHIKQELEQKYPKIFKTIPVRKTSHLTVRQKPRQVLIM